MCLIILSGMLFGAYLLNYCARRTYPNEHQQFIIDGAFHAIYIASRLQLVVLKVTRILLPWLKNNTIKSSYVEFISNDNGVVYKTQRREIDYEIVDNINYDFVVYSVPGSNTVVDKKIRNGLTELLTELEKSTVKFMLIEVKFAETTFKIDLKKQNDNYYIEGNVIDARFLHYFLNRYYSDEIKDVNIDCYTLFIIDNNVNMFELNVADSIQLRKNTYDILRG